MPPDPRPRPGRRTLLVALATGSVTAAAGCGIRLEDDAPRVPLLPARTPVPAEDLLVGLVADSVRLAGLAASVTGPLAGTLGTLHRRQVVVLTAALRSGGVPADVLSSATGPPATATAGPTSTALPSRTVLADAERAGADLAGRFAGVPENLRAPVAALHAQRSAAATLLGERAAALPPETLAGLGRAADALGRIGSAIDGATYFLEVVEARLADEPRRRAADTRTSLAAVRREVAAAVPLVPAPLGHPLPFPVETAADARRLARAALTSLRATCGGALEPLVSDAGADGLVVSARWLGAVEVAAHRWGVPLAPFPGLS